MYFKQYLAIDYGTTHIKGVLFRQFLGSFSILRNETLEIVKLKENEEDEYEYNIIRFIQSFFPEESTFIFNVPMDNLFIRDIALNMSNESEIRNVIPYEVENVVPFPIETMVVQSSIWKIGKEVANVLTFSTHNTEIENTFKPFLKNDTQIDCISNDASSLSSLIHYHQAKSFTDKTIGQLDVGGRMCIFNVNLNGKLSHSRFFSGGGYFITQKIMSLMNLDYRSAENLKFELNFSFAETSPERREEFLLNKNISRTQLDSLIKIVEESFDLIVNEIIKSIYALSPENRPSIIYLTGGGGKFIEIEKYLTSKISIQVKKPAFLEIDDISFATSIGQGHLFRLKKSERVDFLTPEFSRQMKNSFKFEAFKPHLIIAGVSLFVLISVFFVQWVLDSRKSNHLDDTLREKFQAGFAGVPLDESDDVMSKAKTLLKDEQKRSEIVTKFLNKENILELILELNQSFPQKENFNFVLDRFFMDESNKISIKGRVNEFQDLGPIEQGLQKSSKLKNVKITNKNQIIGAKEFKINFTIEMEVVNLNELNSKKEDGNAE
jgi:general secretion pathway protein L